MAGDPLAPEHTLTPDMASPSDLGPSPLAGQMAPTQARTDIYTVMLILSFLAICTACVMLYLELKPYGEWMQWWIIPQSLKA